jgi:hypothetical protein
MDYTLTDHALDAVAKRKILLEWLERTLGDPQRVELDATDPALEHRLAVIPEYGNRALRVIVNRSVDPMRVVTLFFDRKMRGRL